MMMVVVLPVLLLVVVAEQASLLSMRVICRYFNDVQIVLGGMGVMIVACMMFVLNPEGRSGLPLFLWAVFLMYSVGYPIGHTAVSVTLPRFVGCAGAVF